LSQNDFEGSLRMLLCY